MDPQAAHLDTTILLEPLKGTERAARTGKWVRSLKIRTTSSYALHELNRTWIRDLVFLHTRFVEGDALSEVMRKIHALHRNAGRVGRMMEQISSVIAAGEREGQPLDDIEWFKAHLSQLIFAVRRRRDSCVDTVFRETGCARVDIMPTTSPTSDRIDFTIRKCDPKKPPCRLNRFVPANMDRVEKVRATLPLYLKSTQLERAIATIDATLPQPDEFCSQDVCAKLGDILVSFDSGPIEVLASNNDREWEPLSTALGRQHVNPTK